MNLNKKRMGTIVGTVAGVALVGVGTTVVVGNKSTTPVCIRTFHIPGKNDGLKYISTRTVSANLIYSTTTNGRNKFNPKTVNPTITEHVCMYKPLAKTDLVGLGPNGPTGPHAIGKAIAVKP